MNNITAIIAWKERLIDEAHDKELAQKIGRAVELFFARDAALLLNNVNERTITGQLAAHLRTEFADWDVDCEYNRDGHLVKRMKGDAVVPDIIVHRRGTTDNFLVIEVKKSNSRIIDDEDLGKLDAFRNSHLRYRNSLFIKFIVGRRAPGIARLQWV